MIADRNDRFEWLNRVKSPELTISSPLFSWLINIMCPIVGVPWYLFAISVYIGESSSLIDHADLDGSY